MIFIKWHLSLLVLHLKVLLNESYECSWVALLRKSWKNISRQSRDLSRYTTVPQHAIVPRRTICQTLLLTKQVKGKISSYYLIKDTLDILWLTLKITERSWLDCILSQACLIRPDIRLKTRTTITSRIEMTIFLLRLKV